MKKLLIPGVRRGLLTVLAVAVLVSAVAVAYSSYLNRQSFIELKRSLADYAALQTAFGQLQLEKSSWTSPAVVQAEAERNLGMRTPRAEQTVIIVKPRGIARHSDSSESLLAVNAAQ